MKVSLVNRLDHQFFQNLQHFSVISTKLITFSGSAILISGVLLALLNIIAVAILHLILNYQ